MYGHTPPICRSIEHDEQATHRHWSPTEPVEHELAGETALHVESADRVVDGGQLRLDLDDQRDPVRWPKRQDVDGAALAKLRKRDLDVHVPSFAKELVCDLTDDGRVALVEQAIDLAAAPRDDPIETSVDRREGPAEDADR